MSIDYWKITLEELLSDCAPGVALTREQTNEIAKGLKDAAEVEGDYDSTTRGGTDPRESEIAKLKREVAAEREQIVRMEDACPDCAVLNDAKRADLEAALRAALRVGLSSVCVGGECGECPTCRVALALGDQVVRVARDNGPLGRGYRYQVLSAGARRKRGAQ